MKLTRAADSTAWSPSAHALHTSTFLHVCDITDINGTLDASVSKPIAVACAVLVFITLHLRLAHSRGHRRRHMHPDQKSDKNIYCIPTAPSSNDAIYINKLQSQRISSGSTDRQAISPPSQNQDPTHHRLDVLDRHTQKGTVYEWAPISLP